jgi:IS30 family transposase
MGNRYQQLSLSERVYIQAQLELGFKAAAIAAALKRSATTLSRELRRNRWKRTKRSPAKAERGPMPPIGYLADQARQRAASKAAKPRGEFRTEVIALLRHGHKKRRPRAQGRRGQIPNMISIAERPAKIADRLIPGHWEGYTIKGKYNR